MSQLHIRAIEDPLPPLSLDTLDNVMRKLPVKAVGVDALTPLDIQCLPLEGRQGFCQLLEDVEQAGTWPTQLLGTIGALLPKPKGGERVIGLLPETAKIWSRARYRVTSSWSSGLDAFWDTAERTSESGKHNVQSVIELDE